MDSVLEATVHRIKAFENEKNSKNIKSDFDYAANNISKQETKASLIGNKFIQTLFSLFDHDSLSSDHFVQILQIMQKLATLRSARAIITKYIAQIVKLLKSENECVRLHACTLLSVLCLFDDAIISVSNQKIIDILHNLMFDDNERIVLEALTAFAFLTNYNRTNKEMETPKNVILRLIQILSTTQKFDVIPCNETLKILSNLCAKWKMKQAVIEHNAIKFVAKFLSTSYAKKEEKVSRSASALLMSISVCESGKESLLSNKAIIASLCYLVSNKSIDPIICTNSRIALLNISDHPNGIFVVGKELIHKHALLIDMFGCDKAAKIGFAQMKNSENAFIQQSALQILALIAQQKNGIDAVCKNLNVCENLIDVFMMAQKDRTVAIALDCIIMLCQKNKTAQTILRKEARRNDAFYQTAKQIQQLQPFIADNLM